MPGYAILDIDKKNLDKEFLCECCDSVLRGARRAGCGHFFCSSCVENCFRKNKGGVSYCPETRRPLFYFEFLPADDNFCDKVHKLSVHCLFSSEGCPWTGILENFEEHVGDCAFATCDGKKMELCGNGNGSYAAHGSQMDVNIRLDCNEGTLPQGSAVTSQKQHSVAEEYNGSQGDLNESIQVTEASIITDRKVNCVYPWCNMLVHVDDLRGHLETFHLFSQWNRKKCKYCKGQVDLSVLEWHYEECPAWPVKPGKCGKDQTPQAKHVFQKEQVNDTLPLSRKLNLPLAHEEDVKETIAPSLKGTLAGNSDAPSASTLSSLDVLITDQHEQRLNHLEDRVDLLSKEKVQLKQEIFHLTNVFYDVSCKVQLLEQALARELCRQKEENDIIQANLNSLRNEQMNLQSQFDRVVANPLSQEERARFIRQMDAIQGRIRRLEQHMLSHRNMLAEISTSVTSLANAVASDRIPGVDIRPV